MNYLDVTANALAIAKPENVFRSSAGWAFQDGGTVSIHNDHLHCNCATFANHKRCAHTVAIGCMTSDETKAKCEDHLVAAYSELQRRASFLTGAIANGTDAAHALKQQRGTRWQSYAMETS